MIFSAVTINESRNVHLEQSFKKNTIGVKERATEIFGVRLRSSISFLVTSTSSVPAPTSVHKKENIYH